ncbi:MAG: hypothetical protein M1819_005308 [Sarea resinae]|nr:MAG: hypothetical protein M1819_005308 [Sarea resinae]
MSSKLDQIVKGAPSPNAPVPIAHPTIPPQNLSSASTSRKTTNPPLTPTDPISTLPSSPPQIYLNLLILEASLRAQYLTLQARRRQHTFFLLLLASWISYFVYALFLRPREDGSGMGGSVYWVVEMFERIGLLGGIVTAILVWGTGQWERGVRWPRRWIGVANRGLRTMNTKIIIIKGPWWKEMLSHLAFIFPYSSFFPSQGSSYHHIDHTLDKRRDANINRQAADDESSLIPNEDLAPGGDHIRLLLLPKPFSPDFRENWETYRTEYWEKENERRAHLRQRLHKRKRQLAKEAGGWLWWTGWRGWSRAKSLGGRGGAAGDLERMHSHRHHHHASEKDPIARNRTLGVPGRSGSQSRSRASSRSSTSGPPDRESSTAASGPGDRRRRRRSPTASSTASSTSTSTATTTATGPTSGRRAPSVARMSSTSPSSRPSTPRGGAGAGAGAPETAELQSSLSSSPLTRGTSRVGASSSSSAAELETDRAGTLAGAAEDDGSRPSTRSGDARRRSALANSGTTGAPGSTTGAGSGIARVTPPIPPPTTTNRSGSRTRQSRDED